MVMGHNFNNNKNRVTVERKQSWKEDQEMRIYEKESRSFLAISHTVFTNIWNVVLFTFQMRKI